MRPYSNQRKYDDAIRRMVSRGAKQGEPDITKYVVFIDGEPHIVGEKINEINGDKTVTVFAVRLDDHGKAYTHAKDVILCSCGCKLNIKAHDNINRCKICKRIVCPQHSFYWASKDASFCKKSGCYIAGRSLQIVSILLRLFSFIMVNIFGLRPINQEPQSPTSATGVVRDGSRVNELSEKDIRRFIDRDNGGQERYYQ